MAIHALPQFEEDVRLDAEDRARYEALAVPKTLVVRFGAMGLVGEFAYEGSAKPGCGSKVVVRTHRGTELGEMLTSTCPNSGCSKSVSRKEMLEYVERSGGRDYPFFSEGKVLRIATREDLDRQAELEQSRHGLRRRAAEAGRRARCPAKIADVEPLLGGERVIVYYLSEERVDLRDLSRELGSELGGRVELRQVGARDEARLTADYERCGQYCCCKNFLKVLKPISMKSAKVQKATLEPLKISGRCGRLMCCLRYEDETYEDLRKRLPRKRTRVGTPSGDGTVIDGQILTQLVLVRMDSDGKDIAVPVEALSEPRSMTPPVVEAPRAMEEGRRPRPFGSRGPGMAGGQMTPGARPPEGEEAGEARPARRRKRRRRVGEGGAPDAGPGAEGRAPSGGFVPGGAEPRNGAGSRGEAGPRGDSGAGGPSNTPMDGAGGPGAPKRKRRRRRKRHGGGESAPGGSGEGPNGPGERPSGPGGL